MSADNSIRFSLVAGGPFHHWMSRAGLLGGDALPSWKAAVFLAALAWLPPAVLVTIQSLLHESYSGWDYFLDGTVYTRYLVAIGAMLVTEKFADVRISLLVNQFLEAKLLGPAASEEFVSIVNKADRRSGSVVAEGLILVLALAWSWLSFYFVSSVSNSGWEETVVNGESSLSWAGTLAEFLGNPIFLFLLFRWLWRFLVWTALLFDISRLPLRLTAIHPDRAGGLAFLSIFPGVFGGLIFALSCVVASSMLKTIDLIDPGQLFIWLAIGGWILLMMAVFLLPLLVFMAPLYRVRETAMLEFGKLAQLHHKAFHERWIEQCGDPGELLGSPDVSSVADLNACVQEALNMQIIPLSLGCVLQTLVAAALPFLVVVATQVPLAEILKWFVGAIF